MSAIETINTILDKLYNTHQIIVKCNDMAMIKIDCGELIYKTIFITTIIYLANFIFILTKKAIK